jgi:UDP-glucose 4-epimerase
MKIMITGGAGFIGSHIADLLVSEGHDVAVIDSLVHGKLENLNEKVRFYEYDIRDRGIRTAFEEFRPEVLIHEAAQIKVPNSIKDPLYDAEVNILGTLNLLECCREFKVRKVIYPATAAMFSDPQYLPIDEKHPLSMMSGYGVSKHTVEHYLEVYSKLYNLSYTVLRYSNVYGPRQDSTGEGGVVAIFCEKMTEGLVPEIYGDGNQTRDFIYVKDVAKANALALDSLDNEIYNCCTGTEISVIELYKEIARDLGFNGLPVFREPREGDIYRTYMTYKKLNDAIGWAPSWNISGGIRETLDYYRNRKNN